VEKELRIIGLRIITTRIKMIILIVLMLVIAIIATLCLRIQQPSRLQFTGLNLLPVSHTLSKYTMISNLGLQIISFSKKFGRYFRRLHIVGENVVHLVRPFSAIVSAEPPGRISVKFDIGHFYGNLSRISIFG
jgi:hypothetical protein